MKHLWRKLLLLSFLMLPWQAGANQPDVLGAAKSVYRLWIAVPLPTQIATQIVNPQMLSEINNKGYVRGTLQNGQELTSSTSLPGTGQAIWCRKTAIS